MEDTIATNLQTFHSSQHSYKLLNNKETERSFCISLAAQQETSINLTPVDPDLIDLTAESDASNSQNASLNAEANDQKSVRRSKRKNTIESDSDSSNSCKKRRVEVGSVPVRVGKRERKKCPYPLCTVAPKDAWHLKRHMKTRHGNLRPYKCEICSVGFNREDRLKRHTLEHKTLLNFKCLGCPRRFETNEDKVSHQTRCIKRQLQCYMCGYKTIFKPELENHIHIKHPPWC